MGAPDPVPTTPGTPLLRADRDEIGRFVRGLFANATEGGTVSLRAFFDDALARRRNDPPFKVRNVRLNGGGLGPVIEAAAELAEQAARAGRPVVVAPPIATFKGGKADEKGLLEGLVLSVGARLELAASCGLSREDLPP